MYKIITTVGSSIFTNYMEYAKQNEKDDLNLIYLRNNFSENNEDRNSIVKEKINKWINSISYNEKKQISAEIKSLIKLQKEKKDKLDVYLITTDTIDSYLAAEIIKDFFDSDENISIRSIIRIPNLQVEKFKKFEEGKDNLINEIDSLIYGFVKDIELEKQKKYLRENVIFNITGGYKGIIPIMTILAQLYECVIFYIFEKSEDMIFIPRIPINFDPILTESLYLDLWFLKENDSYNLQNKEKLKEFGFINQQNKITALGNLFYKMVQKHQAIGKNVFGYFVEFKILEYFYRTGKLGFTHSFKEKHENSKDYKRELDFAFCRKNDKLEVWEIKPATRMLDYPDKIQEQIENQIAEYPNIIEHHTIFYSINKQIENKIQKNVREMLSSLKSKFKNIKFEAEFLFLDGMQIGKQNKKVNPYQTLFDDSLKDENFTKIYLEEENV